jgi:hypothetical protein
VALADSKEQTELADRIAKIVRKYYPDAKITQDNGVFLAKHGTMIFTIHPVDKLGEVKQETYQAEGPNYQGFIIGLGVKEEGYEGAAILPGYHQGPYWDAYFDYPPTADGKAYHSIHFAHGVSLNKEFKQAIFEALPRTQRKTKKP